MGFAECNHITTHLGMPFCRQKSRTAACNAIIERIENKLNGWKEKCLSQASRTILIKAVAQSIPTYAMSTCIFPKSICSKIDAMYRKLWWGCNNNGNALMLKCWDSICSPKSSGGLGFKRAYDLNIGLMAKMTWLIASDQNIFWIKLIKSKYLRGKSFLADDPSALNCSWLWTDICSCRLLIKEGALYPVTTNSNIQIWTDPWIPSIPNFTPTTSSSNTNTLSLSLVRNLIDQANSCWNMNALNATFSSSSVKEILKIQISPLDRPKTLLWSLSLSGNFSTKSVYLFSQKARFNHTNILIPDNWNNIWNCKIHNRLKHLFWRIINNILPCKTKIGAIFPLPDSCCYLCNSSIETLDRLFITCPFVQQIWSLSFWMLNISCFAHLSIRQWICLIFEKDNLLFTDKILNLEFILYNALVFDNIWRYRNSLAHGGVVLTVQDLVTTITKQADYHWLSIVQSTQSRSPINHLWKAPPICWLKINVDVAFTKDTTHTGVVLRNEHGSISLAAAFKHSCPDAVTAEALAILDAIDILNNIKPKKVIIESDCLNVVSFINGSSNNTFWTASPVVDRIRRCWNCWPTWIFKYTHRSSNGAAHNLANWADNYSFVGYISLDDIPVSVFCDQGYPLVTTL
ncbi:hypothetical protein CASFOL_029297 [Castilleja foliolosa]|uniref:RNase H type-1 domain-containing protein n=1 Tax=Castilleja foliolosa TaxID=1961234 RepID=A0ABD3CBG9_9LAMI